MKLFILLKNNFCKCVILLMCYRRLKVYIIYIIVLIGLFFVLLMYFIRLFKKEIYFWYLEFWICNVMVRMWNVRCYDNNIKMILFYIFWFGCKLWLDIVIMELYLFDCFIKKCKIIYNVDDVGKSDLIIFYVLDIFWFVRIKEFEKIYKYWCII